MRMAECAILDTECPILDARFFCAAGSGIGRKPDRSPPPHRNSFQPRYDPTGYAATTRSNTASHEHVIAYARAA